MTLRTGESAALPTGPVRLAVHRADGRGAPRADACALVVRGGGDGSPGGGADAGGRGGGGTPAESAADLVHAGAPLHPCGAVRHEGAGGSALGVLSVDLAALPAEVSAVVLLARAAGGARGTVPRTRVTVAAGKTELVGYERPGRQGSPCVLGECFRHGGGWRFRAAAEGPVSGAGVARSGAATPGAGVPADGPEAGCDGPAAVAAAYGLRPDDLPELSEAPGVFRPAPDPPPSPPPDDASIPAPAGDAPDRTPLPPAEVWLSPEAPSVALARHGVTAGTLRLSLHVDGDLAPELGNLGGDHGEGPGTGSAGERTRAEGRPVLGRFSGGRVGRRRDDGRRHGGEEETAAEAAARAVEGAAAPDLCALFELSDGGRGVVQALGGATGSLREPPYIRLDGADTGAGRPGSGGTSVTLSLDHAARFRRVLFFLTVQPAAAGFAGLRTADVELRAEHGAGIRFGLGPCTDLSTVCVLALLVRDGPDLVVRREARYLLPPRGVSPQRTVDYAYGWGLNWRPAPAD